MRIANIAHHLNQYYDPNAQAWLSRELVDDNKATETAADLRSHWKVEANPFVLKVDSPKVSADPVKVRNQVDPKASIYSPYYAFSVKFPEWMAYYTGLPAYFSVNIYVALGGEWTYDGTDLGPFLHLNVGKLLQFAKLSEVLFTRVSPQLASIRMVAWGLIAPAADLLVSANCQLRLIQPPNNLMTDPTVTYHVIAACGTSFIQADAPPPPKLQAKPTAPLLSAFDPPIDQSESEDWVFTAHEV